ncbi:MAG: glutaredoxin family protein [Pseudomonadota bacterium]
MSSAAPRSARSFLASTPFTVPQLGVLALLVGLIYGITQWWQVRQTDEAVARSLAVYSRPGEILMISSETCTHCASARRWMHTRDVAFTECVIEQDTQCAARYQALYAPGTPVLVVRDQVLLGFSPQAIWNVLKAPVRSSPQGA